MTFHGHLTRVCMHVILKHGYLGNDWSEFGYTLLMSDYDNACPKECIDLSLLITEGVCYLRFQHLSTEGITAPHYCHFFVSPKSSDMAGYCLYGKHACVLFQLKKKSGNKQCIERCVEFWMHGLLWRIWKMCWMEQVWCESAKSGSLQTCHTANATSTAISHHKINQPDEMI